MKLPTKLPTIGLGLVCMLSVATVGLAQTERVYTIADDVRFKQQNFSQPLFQKIAIGGAACRSFGLKEFCSYQRRHPFKDAMLITEKESTASVTATLLPKQPVEMQQAIFYAKILSRNREMDFGNPENLSGKVLYKGCSFENMFLCGTELTLTSTGTIAKIVVTHTSP
jgi:hypothetical protein